VRRIGEVQGPRGGIELRSPAADLPLRQVARTSARVVAGALFSTVLSTFVAAIAGNSYGRTAPHVAFLLAAGAIAIVLELAGYNIGSIDRGLLFAFFLFEPIGLIVLREQAVPKHLFLTLASAMGMACAFAYLGSRKERIAELSSDEFAAPRGSVPSGEKDLAEDLDAVGVQGRENGK